MKTPITILLAFSTNIAVSQINLNFRVNKNTRSDFRSRVRNEAANPIQRNQLGSSGSTLSKKYITTIEDYRYGKGFSGRYDPYSKEFETKTQENILTKAKNEDLFLKLFFIFAAENKLGNTALLKCNVSTLRYIIVSRDDLGLPKEVKCTYSYLDKTNKPLNENHEIIAFFDNGLPYHLSYPTDILYPRYPFDKGMIGELAFTPAQHSRMVKLCDQLSEKRRIENRPRIAKTNDSLTKEVVRLFPGEDCSKCLTRTVSSREEIEKKEKIDLSGDPYYVDEPYTNFTISIVNHCNKKLKAIAIVQGIDKMKRTYSFSTRTFEPNQVISFTRASNDLAGGMIASLLFGGGETSDIDLSRINKQYDEENGGEVQFLRIIEDK